MPSRDIVYRPAVLVLLNLCLSFLAKADSLSGDTAPEPPAKTTASDSSSSSSTGSDVTEAAVLHRPSSNDMLLLVDRAINAEKVISKREDNDASALSGMWFGPRMGRKVSEETPEDTLGRGMWFGPRMGRAAGNDRGDVSTASGMWFGPRMGRASGRATDDRELASGMWFGPRMGRSVADSTRSGSRIESDREAVSGMWFGPTMRRSYEIESMDDADQPKHDNVLFVFRRQLPKNPSSRESRDASERGMWFGARRGRVSSPKNIDDGLVILRRRTEDRESSAGGMWFGPRMGRKRDADWEAIGRKGREQTAGMWFGPRLG